MSSYKHTTRVDLFPLPLAGDWCASLGAEICAMELSLASGTRKIVVPDSSRLRHHSRPRRDQLDSSIHFLWDRSSDEAVLRPFADMFSPGRSLLESQILSEHFADFSQAFKSRSAISFLELVLETAPLISNLAQGFRTNDVYSSRDCNGYRKKFSNPYAIIQRMEEIHRFVYQNVFRHPIFTAVVSAVAITNCHPLMDGNGRLSRIVFNAIIRLCDLAKLYLPLYEIFWISGCCYELNVRRAEIFDDWKPLFLYFKNAVRLLFEGDIFNESNSLDTVLRINPFGGMTF